MSSDTLLRDLPDDLRTAVERQIDTWNKEEGTKRLWSRDATLWTGSDEAQWLGWLEIVGKQNANLAALKEISSDVKEAGFTYAVVLGMGGSSMCPEVLSMSFDPVDGFPQLLILDSTDPAQIAALEQKIDIRRTLFIVASKSGSTIEPNIFMQYFLARAREQLGPNDAARHFVAITDPGSKLEAFARTAGFRHIYSGVADIGGRYSALSNFGLVPAAVMGLDTGKMLARASAIVERCGATRSPRDNPGVALGIILGVAHNLGRDKLTIVCPPEISDFGAWLEQLVAESTGKHGKAIIPVDREKLAEPEAYGHDRLFVHIKLSRSRKSEQSSAIEKIARSGHPVVRIDLEDVYDLGAEFFRWEMATAVAGAVIGINPFDQPDVESAKVEARRIAGEYEATGQLPRLQPIFEDAKFSLYADDANLKALSASSPGSVAGYLRAHLGQLKAGDYFCLLAFLEMNERHEQLLQDMRESVLQKKHVATCLGFGPRFLHSTGQAHKGGPSSGLFLQLTCDDSHDLPVPEQKYSFGIIKAAQAGGDYAVLCARRRRLLRVHLRGNVEIALGELKHQFEDALKPA